MKKVVMLLAVTMLLFGFGSQAMAAFSAGDLIQVVYKTGGTGNEVITDLGSITTWTTSGSVPTKTFAAPTVSLSSFGGASWSDLNVAYFTFDGSSDFWMSGQQSGEANNAGAKAGTKSGMNSVMQLGSGSQITIASSNSSSYWNKLDGTGTHVGGMGTFINGGTGAEANLTALASGGSADLWLYYYPTLTANSVGTGKQLAKLTLNANGTTSVTAVASTPVPPSVLLLGSGLLGLVGIRRKMSV